MTDHTVGAIPPEPEQDNDPHWLALLDRRIRPLRAHPDSPLEALYGPLCARRGAGVFVVGHLAQSLDGCIATVGGMSRWLSGDADLLHTHRMRALCDAVMVGVNTVLHDDPQLTVRRCAGVNPVRVIIDPERRLDARYRVFQDGAAETLVLAAADRASPRKTLGQAEVVPVARGEHGLDPHEIARVLAQRGLSWLFIEGGGNTVSRFLAAGALDRLQITVASVIIGSGRPGIRLPEIGDLRDSLRPLTRRFILGDDIMIECAFRE